MLTDEQTRNLETAPTKRAAQQAERAQQEHSALCMALADREPTAAGRLYLMALATVPVGQCLGPSHK